MIHELTVFVSYDQVSVSARHLVTIQYFTKFSEKITMTHGSNKYRKYMDSFISVIHGYQNKNWTFRGIYQTVSYEISPKI